MEVTYPRSLSFRQVKGVALCLPRSLETQCGVCSGSFPGPSQGGWHKPVILALERLRLQVGEPPGLQSKVKASLDDLVIKTTTNKQKTLNPNKQQNLHKKQKLPGYWATHRLEWSLTSDELPLAASIPGHSLYSSSPWPRPTLSNQVYQIQ